MAVSIITSHLQQCDSNGVPLNAGTVTVYASGTTTPLTLYSDDDLDAGDAITNPITLDASGRHAMVFIATAAYKIVVKNSAGTTIYTHDEIDPGVAIGSGALPVANGGTGATTAASARTNLAAASATDVATAQSDIVNLNTWTGYNGTGATRLPVGTTAQRPGAPSAGHIRQNSTNTKFEGYISAGWDNLMLESANAAATADVNSETAAATFIRPDRLINSRRVAQATGYVTWSGATPTLVRSIGVASITDTGAGQLTVTLSPAMADTNYVVCVGVEVAASTMIATIRSKTTSSFIIAILTVAPTLADPDAVSFAVFKN